MSQLRHLSEPPRHHFIVFSVIEDDDTVRPKFAQCNNCGVIHKVIDICRSEIVSGKDHMPSLLTIDDIKTNIPSPLATILEGVDADLPTWEAAQFIVENKFWGDIVVLTTDHGGGSRQGKYVRILGESLFKVDTFYNEETLG